MLCGGVQGRIGCGVSSKAVREEVVRPRCLRRRQILKEARAVYSAIPHPTWPVGVENLCFLFFLHLCRELRRRERAPLLRGRALTAPERLYCAAAAAALSAFPALSAFGAGALGFSISLRRIVTGDMSSAGARVIE